MFTTFLPPQTNTLGPRHFIPRPQKIHQRTFWHWPLGKENIYKMAFIWTVEEQTREINRRILSQYKHATEYWWVFTFRKTTRDKQHSDRLVGPSPVRRLMVLMTFCEWTSLAVQAMEFDTSHGCVNIVVVVKLLKFHKSFVVRLVGA